MCLSVFVCVYIVYTMIPKPNILRQMALIIPDPLAWLERRSGTYSWNDGVGLSVRVGQEG